MFVHGVCKVAVFSIVCTMQAYGLLLEKSITHPFTDAMKLASIANLITSRAVLKQYILVEAFPIMTGSNESSTIVIMS